MKRSFTMAMIVGSIVLCSSAASAKDKTAWMIGNWTGVGYQANNGHTWTMELAVAKKGGADSYTISYPSLNCGGYWELKSAAPTEASFLEHITHGRAHCTDAGHVTIRSIAGHKLQFHYEGPQAGEYADATLVSGVPKTKESGEKAH